MHIQSSDLQDHSVVSLGGNIFCLSHLLFVSVIYYLQRLWELGLCFVVHVHPICQVFYKYESLPYRGMFTLCSYHPVVTETLPIPKLCLTGRAPPRNTAVDLSHIDTPHCMSAWPQFHNGAAAGLRIANSSQVITIPLL